MNLMDCWVAIAVPTCLKVLIQRWINPSLEGL